MTTIKLTQGTMEVAENMGGWIITSAKAYVVDAEDMPLEMGDYIDTNGDVFRDGEHIGNVE